MLFALQVIVLKILLKHLIYSGIILSMCMIIDVTRSIKLTSLCVFEYFSCFRT